MYIYIYIYVYVYIYIYMCIYIYIYIYIYIPALRAHLLCFCMFVQARATHEARSLQYRILQVSKQKGT